MSLAILIALGRILAEPDSVLPDVDDDVMLLIKRQNVTIGCTADDGGMPGDAAIDAPIDAPGDAADAGIDDGGVADAGTPDAATCEMIPGDAVTMIVQPRVSTSADGTRFAVLLVTPQRPLVEVQSYVFEPLARVTAPVDQIQEIEVPDPSLTPVCASPYGADGCGGGSDDGCGGDWDDPGGPDYTPPPLRDAGLGDGGIVEETVGPYQFVRAQPTSSAELATWLDQLGYAYMPADLDAVAPYIALGYHVVAMRIAADTMTGSLVPVALTWPGSELRVPAALGGSGPVGFGQITVYIAADRKYVLPGAKVRFAKYTGNSTAPYLTRNELVLYQNLPVTSDPIAFETTGDVQEVNIVKHYVHVPVEVTCDEEDDGGCCGNCNAKPRARLDWGVLAIAVLVVLRRRRRR